MRAVLYARVSTDEQADKGYSLPSQLEACRKYAEDHAFIVVAEFSDDYTGTHLDRPELDRVRELTARHEGDAVIVYASDRLTRKLAHLLILREEWQRAGIELHFVRRGKSENTPESRMTENIEGVFNEYWREKIVEACRRGSHRKAIGGKVVGCGKPPYGYHYFDGGYVIFEEEAGVIRLIYVWYIDGDGDSGPMPIYTIAKRLSEMSLPTPGEKRPCGKRRVRACGIWDPVTVLNILRSETYAGIWRFGKRVGSCGKEGKRSIDEQVAVKVPAIIERDVWEKAQRQREHNKQMSKRNCKREYLLRGLVFCGCGRRMAGVGGEYYICNHRFHRFKGEKMQCVEKSARMDRLEAVVSKYIRKLLADPVRFKRALLKARKDEREALKPKREELTTVERLIGGCEGEANKLANALTQAPNGVVGNALQAQINQLEKEYTALKQRREELQAALAAESMTNENIAAAMQFRTDLIQGMKSPTFDDMRHVLELLQVKVTVKENKAQIKCIVPVKPSLIDLSTG